MQAQLILVGGRLIPNILSVIYQQPEFIIAVCSLQSHKREWLQLRKAIQNLVPTCQIKEEVVDGYLLEQIEQACEKYIGQNDKETWVFNVTNATSIMSIGAYNIAKKYAHTPNIDLNCWFLDTPRSRIIALVGKPADKSIFDLEVAQYIAAYDYRLVPGNLEEERAYSETHWLPFCYFLVEHIENINTLKKFVGKISNQKPQKKDGSQERSIADSSEAMYTFLIHICGFGLIDNLRKESGRVFFNLTYLQANFLEGTWLEAYVWNQAFQLSIFSDCLWNQKLIANERLTDKESENELDVALIYKAQLFIVECKTGKDEGFKSEILYKIDSVANPLGNWSVGKVLVMSLSIPDESDKIAYKKYEEFKHKARDKGITLVTREELSNVGTILRGLTENTNFSR